MTQHQLSVLKHVSYTGRYITDEASVFAMAEAGLLHDHGGIGFWPAGTRGFTLSSKGRKALRQHYAELCRFPQPKPKRKPSRAFLAWRDYVDACGRISFREFWKEIWPSYEFR